MQPKIIGVWSEYGNGTGKDLVAKYIRELYPTYELDRLSAPVKIIVAAMTGCTIQDLEDRNFKESEWKSGCTYRSLMEEIGDGFRQKYGEDIWIDGLLKRNEGVSYVVIPDVRYVNEAEKIIENGGIILNKLSKTDNYIQGKHDVYISQIKGLKNLTTANIEYCESMAKIKKQIEKVL